ncbi:MAG: cytochrome c-type biogenesis protein CcmH [Rhodobacteraceae bacterium]|nr:MAG: cytochrome c-type biogenesis protein CcmH [Paracoccaceae bacterium]
MRAVLIALVLLAGQALAAVQPDELLDDPVLEARARQISSGLRCLVCRNESIDDSDAEFSRTMRLLVRERLLEGDTDEEVMAFIVDRYGEYVLLKPKFSMANAFIWLSGPLLFAAGGWAAWRFISAQDKAVKPPPAPLSAEEERRLAALLDGPKDAGA